MESGGSPRGGERCACMTLQAELVDLAAFQQSRILRAVRRVTRHAALGLLRRMLEDERAMRFAVASSANLLLCGSGAKLARQESAVLVMTFGTVQQALVH